MKLHKRLCKVMLLSLTFASFGVGNKTEAGTIKLINTTQSATQIYIVSSINEKSYCKKCLAIPVQMCGSETICKKETVRDGNIAKIVVPPDAFQGGEYFSVIDVSSGISGGKCKNLSLLKNYEVSFFETTLGSRCECKEI